MSATERDDPIPWTPGDLVRKCRKHGGLKQEQLAEAIGVSHSTISNWENYRGEPTLTQWRLIIEVTGAPVSWVESQLRRYLDPVELPDGQLELSFSARPTVALVTDA